MLKRELGLEAELVEGRYGEFTVLVDDHPVIRGGPLTVLGIVPSLRRIREVLESNLKPELPSGEQGNEP
jgi:hypothetical protein